MHGWKCRLGIYVLEHFGEQEGFWEVQQVDLLQWKMRTTMRHEMQAYSMRKYNGAVQFDLLKFLAGFVITLHYLKNTEKSLLLCITQLI